MALFKKSHSRSRPIVETPIITAGITYREGERRYTANLCAPGGPPYVYFELQLSEAEMLNIATGWIASFSQNYMEAKKS